MVNKWEVLWHILQTPSEELEDEANAVERAAYMVAYWYTRQKSPTDGELEHALHILFQARYRVAGYASMEEMMRSLRSLADLKQIRQEVTCHGEKVGERRHQDGKEEEAAGISGYTGGSRSA